MRRRYDIDYLLTGEHIFRNYKAKKSETNCNYYTSDMNKTKLHATLHLTTIQITNFMNSKPGPLI
jgi:hypothetical protein